MLSTNIETEVKKILEVKGNAGWLRASECAKLYARGNASRETSFYRWRRKVEKGKVEGFKILKLPGNISFVGLKSASPGAIETLVFSDKKVSRSVKSGFGFWEYMQWRKLHADQEKERARRELDAELAAQTRITELNEDDGKLLEKIWQIEKEERRRRGLDYENSQY